jgi:TetR/AcrR family transcriptional repressor of nem operon
MARPREFDSDTVLEQAMRVFWTKGYEASSLDDVCDATDLNRSSLYAAFGDKRALFLATLDRYGDRAVARVTAALSRPVHIREAIATFLADMIEQIVAGPGRVGCFIGNCAAEVARHDRAAAASVQRNLQRVEAAFRVGFAAAKSRGELSPETDIDALARFFVASTQGLRLVGKATADRETLDDISQVMLRCLE